MDESPSGVPADLLPKVYDARAVEERVAAAWADLYRAGSGSPDRPRFSMVMPPPNVTGRLHTGHALNNTLPDILARYKRMDGNDVLWLPGTDHAGIATQNVVERELRARGKTRQDLGREEFERTVWRWKEEYGGIITSQLRLLGASCDWSRERFTLDPGLSRAVREVFVALHERGLLYRGLYLVNWCPRCETAISDLEVIGHETRGALTHIRYPLSDGSGHLVVATTRPETMLGDTALALHPEDARRAALEGKEAILPLVGRRLPIVFDAFVDREFGSGIVKVTPAHDAADYACGQRHGLPAIQVIDGKGRMTDAVPMGYVGLDRFECRRKVVADLDVLGAIERVEEHVHNVGRCQRCDEVAEPLLSTQWFVKVAPLAAPAIEAVERGRVTFYPEHFASIYFEWMRNIRDWCVSRQLWWGHRIPAWYCDGCGKTIVSRTDVTRCDACGGAVRQDEDVLDTWFSSALWPFSTMGWPEKTPDLARYYPTDVLITGFDIIFCWVARMIMRGIEFTGEVPFRRVYINGLVRDERGEKMSKTRGNVVDPLDLMREYGTDAVRFTLAVLASPGTDIPLAPKRMEGYKAFVNKVWNASRFVLMTLEGREAGPLPPRDRRSLVDRWILSRLGATAAAVREKLETQRFDEAANQVYQFLWHEYCDWYLELVKPELKGEAGRAEAARAVLCHVLSAVLRLLHPFTPFVTEEIWRRLPGATGSISLAPYPTAADGAPDPEAERGIDRIVAVITRIRNLKASRDPNRRVPAWLVPHDDADRALLASHQGEIQNLARLSELGVLLEAPPGASRMARDVAGEVEVFVDLGGEDVDGERKKLGREIDKLASEIAALQAKLADAGFTSKAPAAVVEKNRQRLLEMESKHRKLSAARAALGS
ncbi:MAG: valine--tRNA ligase [Acidobacteriota bacterium]